MSKKVTVKITQSLHVDEADFAQRCVDRIVEWRRKVKRADSPMPLWLDGRCIWCGDEAIGDDCTRKCASSKRNKATEKRLG